jgi:predicted dehydrogenase
MSPSPAESDAVVRIGVLGAAAITPAALLAPAHAHPGSEVTAVAARDADRARAFATEHGIPRVLDSYDDLIDDPLIDAVYIPLPNSLHGVWTARAIAAGKHVLCEKPFTANAEEATAIAEVADASGLVVMEAFHWRYHPMAQRMIDIVQSGALGRIEHIETAVCFPLLKPGDIRYRLDLAGGALLDAGCYAINMARSVMGAEPEVIDGKATLTSQGVDRAFTGRVRFPGGATGRITCSLMSRRLLALHVDVRGDRGRLRAFNPLMPKLLGHLTIEAGGQRRTEEPTHTETYDHQLHAFIGAITHGRPFPSTAQDAVRNMTVIDDFYRAAGLQPRQPSALEGSSR